MLNPRLPVEHRHVPRNERGRGGTCGRAGLGNNPSSEDIEPARGQSVRGKEWDTTHLRVPIARSDALVTHARDANNRLLQFAVSENHAQRLDAIREELRIDEQARASLIRIRDETTTRGSAEHRRRSSVFERRIDRRGEDSRDTSRASAQTVWLAPTGRAAPSRRPGTRTVSASRNRFLEYAKRFGQRYNKKYQVARGTWGNVDDCTNFVSQALHFAGWKEDKHWQYQKMSYIINYASGFPAVLGGPSAAWENVNQFVHYAVQSRRARYLVVTDRHQIRPGDILVIDWHGGQPGTKDFQPDHLDIVTRVADVNGTRQVYVASHGGSASTSHTHFPFFDIPGATKDSQQQREPRVTYAILRPTWN